MIDIKKIVNDSFTLSMSAFDEYLNTQDCLNEAMLSEKAGSDFDFKMYLEFSKAFVGAAILNYHKSLIKALKEHGIDIIEGL